MPDRNDYAPGTPSWVDLQTSDPDAAKAFYSTLLGWDDVEDMPTPEGAVYSMARIRGRYVAAVAPLPMPGVPPHWNSYVTVADIDATVARVPGAGGTVVMPAFDVMDAGRMAVIQDPTGGVICLWQAKNHIGAQIVNEPGAFCWNELVSPSPDRAIAFYGAVLGWGSEPMEGSDYTIITNNGEQIAGAMKPPMEGIPPYWGVYFAVADCDATVAKARELGASVFAEPMDIPPGRFAALADPQGAMFSVITLNQ